MANLAKAAAGLVLDDHCLPVVRKTLKGHLPRNTVWAFGSRAGGTPKPHSDLDLVNIEPPAVTQATLSLLKLAFEESDLPIRVDIVLFSELDPSFRELIKQAHVPINFN